MRLVTWNVNGIRSISGGFRRIFAELGADLLCIQETKITKDILTADIANIDGYNSYFAFCHNAKKGWFLIIYSLLWILPIKSIFSVDRNR